MLFIIVHYNFVNADTRHVRVIPIAPLEPRLERPRLIKPHNSFNIRLLCLLKSSQKRLKVVWSRQNE